MNRAVFAILGIWFLAAAAIGRSGILVDRARPPLPQLVLVALTITVLVAVRAIPALRLWARSVDSRAYVALHLSRFLGIYFLVLHARGELPESFAVPAGAGDILIAFLALILLGWGAPEPGPRLRAYRYWNVLGLADIVLVVVGATRLALAGPEAMARWLRLPLSLLPTFLVPLIIATHVMLFGKLSGRDVRGASAGQ